jgi:large subunit ribosomal protein L34
MIGLLAKNVTSKLAVHQGSRVSALFCSQVAQTGTKGQNSFILIVCPSAKVFIVCPAANNPE